jgi:integrase
MSRTNRPPKYRRHKQSGLAIVTLTDGFGGRRDVLLGKFGTAASRKEYGRVIAEWEASGRRLPGSGAQDLSVNEVAVQFLQHAQQHYRRPDGTVTTEPSEFNAAIRPLVHLYCALPAAEFSPLKLEAVRRLMVDGYTHPRHGPQVPLSRGVVNQRIGRIVRLFKWAGSKELVPATAHHALKTLTGLQAGRSKARETAPIKPVPDVMVDAVLPHVAKEVAGMICLQRLTGMRPGELCIMRAIDIDMSGPVWLYRPAQHKLAYQNKARVVAIGPRGQEIIRPFLQLDTHAYLFSPRRAQERRYATMRASRKTKVQPSQKDRSKRKPEKRPADCYTTSSYEHAIRAGCDLAFPPPAPLARREDETLRAWQVRLTAVQQVELKAWQKAHRRHPHRLRHTAATKLRKVFGIDAARAVLGHRSPAVTEVYAEIDAGTAATAMEKLG